MARADLTNRHRYVLIGSVAVLVALVAGGGLLVALRSRDGPARTAGTPAPATVPAGVSPDGGAATRGLPGGDPAAARGCDRKPDASNTGPAPGSRFQPMPAGKLATPGQVLENKEFSGLIDIYADNVTIRNSIVHDGIRVRGSNVLIDHVATSGIAIRGGAGHVIQYSNLSGGDDGFHISSTLGPVSGVTIRHNYVHDRRPPKGAHTDGIQVRGVRDLSVVCNNLDLSPYDKTQTAVVFLEWANGGNRDVVIDHNWLNAGGTTLVVAARNLRVTDNRFGRGFRWSVCRLGNDDAGKTTFFSAGNVWADTGQPVVLCGRTR